MKRVTRRRFGFGVIIFVTMISLRTSSGQLIQLLNLPDGLSDTSARIMDASGDIFGGNFIGGSATVWTPGPSGYSAHLLPLPSGAADGFANWANAGGTAAGYDVDSGGNPTAVVWQPTGGGNFTPTALPMPVGATGASAYSINSNGQVAGFGQRANNSSFGVVWTPGP